MVVKVAVLKGIVAKMRVGCDGVVAVNIGQPRSQHFISNRLTFKQVL